MVIWHLKQIGMVKKLDKWMPCELTRNLKNHHFEVLFTLSLCNNNKSFLDQIMTCDETWIYTRQQPAQWLDQKKLQTTSQSQTCTKKKVMVWWSATCLILYSFLNPRETITSEKYAQQIDALINVITATGIGQQKVPSSSPRPQLTTRCTTNALKVE